MALLAAEQVTAQLKASQALEQHVVSKFLHNLCEQVCLPPSKFMGSPVLPHSCWARLEKRCHILLSSAKHSKNVTRSTSVTEG